MQNNFEIYKRWLSADSTADISDNRDDFKSDLIETMKATPAYQESAKVNGEVQPLIITRKGTKKCKVTAIPNDDLRIGDLVEAYDEHWIVIDLSTDEYGIKNGEVWMCNQIFVYQKHDKSIVSKYAILDDGSYSKSGEKSIVVAGNSYDCYMQLDGDNEELYIDKRLAIDIMYDQNKKPILEVGKIKWIDKKSVNFGEGSHLLKIRLERDLYDEHSDDIERMICNYDDGGEVSMEESSCLIEGKNTIRLGTSRTYRIRFVDENSIGEDNIKWETSGDGNGIEIIQNGFSCKINCPINNRLIGNTFELRCFNMSTGEKMCSLELEVVNG